MKIDRKQLIECLDMVSLALGGALSEFKNQCFRFHEDLVQATDGEVSIEAQLPANIGIDCSIHGQSFLSLIKSLDEELIDLQSNDRELVVSTDKVEGKLVIHNLSEFKEYSSNPTKVGTIPNIKEFVDGLIKCRHNVSLDTTSKMVIHGVKISDTIILSTNRYRIFKCKLDFKSGIDCIIPTKFVDVVSKCKDKITGMFCENGSRLVAIIDDEPNTNIWIWTQLLSGDYPDLNKYFSRSTDPTTNVCLPDDIDQVINRHASFVKDVDISNRESLISIDGDKCTIKTTNVNTGILKESVTLKDKPTVRSNPNEDNNSKHAIDNALLNSVGFSIKFYVDPILIKDIIKECKTFSYYSEDKSIIFRTEKFDYFIQVTGIT
jgi:DNA polymerase III sliding clamp (beta) subunit (PCNA family)